MVACGQGSNGHIFTNELFQLASELGSSNSGTEAGTSSQSFHVEAGGSPGNEVGDSHAA